MISVHKLIKDIAEFVWDVAEENEELCCVSTNDVVKALVRKGYSIDKVSAYDYKIGNVILLGTYGDEDIAPDGTLYTVALVEDDGSGIYLADIHGERMISPLWIATAMQKEFQYLPVNWVETIFGKRSFYWYRSFGKVSLHTTPEVYEGLPDFMRHRQAEDWISGPRFWVRLIML